MGQLGLDTKRTQISVASDAAESVQDRVSLQGVSVSVVFPFHPKYLWYLIAFSLNAHRT